VEEATARLVGVVTLQDRFSGALNRMQGGLSKWERYGGRAISNVSRNMERLAVVGVTTTALIGKQIVQSAADFQDAMARVEKTLSKENKTPQNLKMISDGLIEMSKRIPVTAVELAEIAKQAGQLGIEAAPDILAFTETLAKLSRVTELDVTYAADNMGKLRTIFHMNAEELDHFGQILVALENSGASTVQEILNVTRRFAGAGQAAGLAAEDVAALASSITSLGILPEAAGSALSRLFQRTRIEFANGSKKAKEFAKFMDQPFETLKKNLAQNPTGFFLGFLRKVNRVLAAGSDIERLELAAALKAMGIVNVRDIDAVNKLAEGVETVADMLNTARYATDELDEAAKSRFKSFLSQLQIFQNKLNAAAIIIGNAIMPALVDAMTLISDWIEEHEDDITQFAKDVGTNFKNFIGAIKPKDISAFVGVLRDAFDWASKLIGAFMGLPDWAKKLLIGLYVGNKLTGGVVSDIVGELAKGLIKGVLGITAGVVNINAATVNGGLGPGVAGGGGGGAKGLLGMLGRLGLVLGGTALLSQSNSSAGGIQGFGGGLGNVLGGAAIGGGIGGPLGAIAGGLGGAIKSIAEAESGRNTRHAKEIREGFNTSILGMEVPQMRVALSAVNTGISDLTANPLHMLVQGDALMYLQSMRDQLLTNLAPSRRMNETALQEHRRGERDTKNSNKGILRRLDDEKRKLDTVATHQQTINRSTLGVKGSTDRVREGVDRLIAKPFTSTMNTTIILKVDGKTVAVQQYNRTSNSGGSANREPNRPPGPWQGGGN
jgi:TP901 family phage tail tape measure protein